MLVFTGNGDVLWWTVDANATVDGASDVFTFLAPMPYDSEPDYNNVYGARIAIKNSSGDTIGYLNPYYQTNPEETNPMYFNYAIDPDIIEVDIGHPNEGYVGAEWCASKVDREALMEYMFQIELGHDVWNSLLNDYDWNTIAKSDTVEGRVLMEQLHTYEAFDLNPPIQSPWTPMVFHTIPEPSSGLLLLFGLAPLLLTRKSI